MSKRKIKYPNIVRGGTAIPLGNNNYLMRGRSHEQGGIDVGKDLEVEGGEVMHMGDKDVTVYSALPILNGISPAEAIIQGGNPKQVFKAQEEYKKVNKLNDDGTKKAKYGRRKAQIGYGNSLTKDLEDTDAKQAYRDSQAQKIIDAAIQKSYTRTDVSNPILRRLTPEEREHHIGRTAEIKESYIKNGWDLSDNDYYHTMLAELDVNGKFGPNCIFTFTDNYGKKYKVSGNQTFADNPEKYGFTLVDTPKKGDMAQIWNSFDGGSYPNHAMMYIDKDKYNYSSGGHTRFSLRKEGNYPIDDKYQYLKYYRFIGTPDDIARWDEEYKKGVYDNHRTKNKEYLNMMKKVKPINSKVVQQVNESGKPKVRYIPSTGEKTQMRCGGRKKAETGWKGFVKNGYLSDSIGLLSNLTSGLIGYGVNNAMLKKMKAPKEPIAYTPQKLKTRININPQLDRMRETVAAYEQNVGKNTASSKVAQSRIQNARYSNMLDTNSLYGAKENQETELINADIANRQSAMFKNIDGYNNYLNRKNEFENSILDKRSENAIGLLNTINAGFQDSLGRIENRKALKRNARVQLAANPNIPIELFNDIFTPEEIRQYRLTNPLPKVE